MRNHPKYPGYEITQDGKIYSTKRKKFLSLLTGHDGYLRVTLYQSGKGKKIEYVHKLVAECYVSNPKDYKYVVHKDENKKNNKAENLEWRKNNRKITDADKLKEKKLILEYKKFLEEKGYIVLDQNQAQNIMKRIRQS